MTTSAMPSVRVVNDRVEGLEEYAAAMRQSGFDAGRAEGHAAGYAKGRQDAAEIFGSEASRGREALAAELATDASISPERALSLLAKVPASAGGTFARMVEGKVPDVGPNPDSQRDPKQERRTELAEMTKRLAQARR